MTDAEILEHVVALNSARAAEEKAGVIRWLRPEYQAAANSSSKRRRPSRQTERPASKKSRKATVAGDPC